MAGQTQINRLRYPEQEDAPLAGTQIQQLAEDVDSRLVGRFASAAERNNRIPSPEDGMFAWTGGGFEFYANNQWNSLTTGEVATIYGISRFDGPDNNTETRVTFTTSLWTGTLTAGRKYRVSGQGLLDSSVDGLDAVFRVRCRPGTSAPTTNSPIISAAQIHIVDNTRPQSFSLSSSFRVNATGSHTIGAFLLKNNTQDGFVSLIGGSSGMWEVTVDDIGPAPSWVPVVT